MAGLHNLAGMGALSQSWTHLGRSIWRGKNRQVTYSSENISKNFGIKGTSVICELNMFIPSFWLMLHSMNYTLEDTYFLSTLTMFFSFLHLPSTKLWISFPSYIPTTTLSLLPMQMSFQHVTYMASGVLTMRTSEFLTKKYLAS